MSAFMRIGKKTFTWIKPINCPKYLLHIERDCSWVLCSGSILWRMAFSVSHIKTGREGEKHFVNTVMIETE